MEDGKMKRHVTISIVGVVIMLFIVGTAYAIDQHGISEIPEEPCGIAGCGPRPTLSAAPQPPVLSVKPTLSAGPRPHLTKKPRKVSPIDHLKKRSVAVDLDPPLPRPPAVSLSNRKPGGPGKPTVALAPEERKKGPGKPTVALAPDDDRKPTLTAGDVIREDAKPSLKKRYYTPVRHPNVFQNTFHH